MVLTTTVVGVTTKPWQKNVVVVVALGVVVKATITAAADATDATRRWNLDAAGFVILYILLRCACVKPVESVVDVDDVSRIMPRPV